jgi:hypothetical protein
LEIVAKLNVACTPSCLCIPVVRNCYLNPNFILPPPTFGVSDVEDTIEALKSGCLSTGFAVEQCLVKFQFCAKDCTSNLEGCKTALGACLTAGIIFNIGTCGNEPLITLALGAILEVDVCAFLFEKQQAQCGNCLVVGELPVKK